MGTRSRIGLQLEDQIISVYHHWDGYPQWLGVTLNKKFNTREKVEELIDGGDMSSCDTEYGWDYDYSSEEGKRDVLFLGDCDDGVSELCKHLGWEV